MKHAHLKTRPGNADKNGSITAIKEVLIPGMLIFLLVISMSLFTGCSSGSDSSDSASESDTIESSDSGTTDSSDDTESDSDADDSSGDTASDSDADDSSDDTASDSDADDSSDDTESGSDADDSSGDTESDSDTDDPSDSSSTTGIVLNGSTINVDGTGAVADGNKVTITSAGTYRISGTLSDGQVVVDTEDEDIVTLLLNGVDISNSTSAPINITNAEEAVIVLGDNTENFITDSSSYVFEDPEEDEPNAAIFSKDDLMIYGNGSLTVDANYNDGIASKDGLVITGGVISVSSVDDGIRGKDYIIIEGGEITVDADGDGLKSDNDDDAEKGYIDIEDGTIDVTSGGDAVQAETNITVNGGEIAISSGGGSSSYISDDDSAKGIKAGVKVSINGGSFTINSADDAVHSNDSLVINGGSFIISSGDDAVHSDTTLEINDGDINIIKSYEGIESSGLTINGGDIYIISSDDGINAAGGNDGSGMSGPGQDHFSSSGDNYLYINGGYIVVDADGDGLDINGSAEMTAGVVIVNGPTSDRNGALDCNGSFNITGGFLVAAGSSGMAEAPDTSSNQYSVLVNLNSSQQADTIFHIQTNAGSEVLTFAPSKAYESVVFSSPALAGGSSYNVYLGGSSTGEISDGLYENGTYTPGIYYTDFTISAMVTSVR